MFTAIAVTLLSLAIFTWPKPTWKGPRDDLDY